MITVAILISTQNIYAQDRSADHEGRASSHRDADAIEAMRATNGCAGTLDAQTVVRNAHEYAHVE
jgi:hypothetical protein